MVLLAGGHVLQRSAQLRRLVGLLFEKIDRALEDEDMFLNVAHRYP